MRDVVFSGDFFRIEADRPRSEMALMLLLEALTWIDIDHLNREPGTPLLYDSGVIYRRRDEWLSAPSMLREGSADCKSLAAWRCAELRVKAGIQARCDMVGQRVGPSFWLYHVRVLWPSGPWGAPWIEDPSRVLGMGAEEVA